MWKLNIPMHYFNLKINQVTIRSPSMLSRLWGFLFLHLILDFEFIRTLSFCFNYKNPNLESNYE